MVDRCSALRKQRSGSSVFISAQRGRGKTVLCKTALGEAKRGGWSPLVVAMDLEEPPPTREGLIAMLEGSKSLPKNAAIVLYCGCCPWGHCPNVHPAYLLLHTLGYTNVKVIYVTNDFGADWVNKGYPVARGE